MPFRSEEVAPHREVPYHATGSKPKFSQKVLEKSKRLGKERFKSDKRQLGGLMMLLGTNALVFPMANFATLIGPDKTTASEGIALSSLIASTFVIAMGLMAIPLGYLQAVHDWGSHRFTGFLILFTQFAWMPFITDLTDVGRGARSGDAFIPSEYEPSAGDVRFVGAMGMMGILGYGTGFLGSLAFVQFCLYSFQVGKPGDRPGSYYSNRLSIYAFCNLLVGLSQFLLGVYIRLQFGSGPLPNGPIGVAMYLVHFPEISICVGMVQMVNSFFGLIRSRGIHNGPTDHRFQLTTLIQWVLMVTLQILTQVAYAPGGTAAAAAPSQTMLTMGISVIVAYMDFKARTVPEIIADNYYGLKQIDVEQPRESRY